MRFIALLVLAALHFSPTFVAAGRSALDDDAPDGTDALVVYALP